MECPDFPILGTEPLPVELANTLYGGGGERTDFLGEAAWIDQWFACVWDAHGLATTPPTGLDRRAGRVHSLRDAVHDLLSAAADGRAPGQAAVSRVNDFARAAPAYPRLEWPAGGAPAVQWLDDTGGGTAVLGRIAGSCIELLTGERAEHLRRCRGPGCSMLFVKNHSRRRWCHPSCGHRDRQARYYRRRAAPEGSR
ncbi:CGNR zinc finger domain-containing protein [Actinomadura rugatobispora]|uniref:CGNR zinc finger domain-containing protein n=1 Tax=Actinomadura rugatobispora TaxID=1994 RepID=A0ABW0ZUP6_9ACTN